MYFEKFIPGTVRFTLLVLPQPLAAQVAGGEAGTFVLSENSDYRGQVLVCDGKDCLALAFIAGVKQVEGGFEYTLARVRRVIEMPLKIGAGFHTVYIPEGEIMEYPDSKNVRKWMRPTFSQNGEH